MNRITPILAAAALMATTAPALQAETPDLGGEGWSMFGISKATGNLWRYDFPDGQNKYVGKVRDLDGNALVGIDASAYFEYFQSIHAFWNDPSDGQTKMLRVDALTGVAALDVVNLGTDKITGAVAHAVDNPAPDVDGKAETKTFHIYALQNSVAGDGISGGINLNPNNAKDNGGFECTTTEGAVITRMDLHNNTHVDGDGVYYEGAVTTMTVTPKGDGNQNSLVVNGQPFLFPNGTRLDIVAVGDMQVRIQNSEVKNSKPIGNWWVDITAKEATITINGGEVINAAPWPASKIIRIDTQTREVVPVKQLVRIYDSLATSDANAFAATSGNELYDINVTAGTETKVKTMSSNQMFALEYAGTHLLCFEMVDDRLLPVNAKTGEVLGFAMQVGMHNLGTLTFIKTELLPDEDYSRYD